MTIEKKIFGYLNDDNNDDVITIYTIKTEKLSVKIIDYGATIVQLLYPDRKNNFRDLILGFDNLNDYKSDENPYFGSTIGRCSNRIQNGQFYLNNKYYNLYCNDIDNDRKNSLHGGKNGFNKKLWKLSQTNDDNSLTFYYKSINNEENYPGTLNIYVKFEIKNSNELYIDYNAKLDNNDDDDTIISLTNHTYFNLNGCYNNNNNELLNILNHKINIYTDKYLELNDKLLIPTGRILSVKNNKIMDFTTATTKQQNNIIGERKFSYDHCYVLNNNQNDWLTINNNNDNDNNDDKRKIKLAAEIYSPITGIKMSFLTNEPSFQFYIGKYIPDKKFLIKKSHLPQQQLSTVDDKTKELKYEKYSGLCLEAQRFPNAINIDDWRNQVILNARKNNNYQQTTIYKFENVEFF